MEANPKNVFSIKVEDGKPGKDGRLAVGPVFRSVLAKDGFPQLELSVYVKARLGGRLRLLISGGAPLSTEIEEFMRVTTCAYFIQGYGNAYRYILQFQTNPEMGYDPLGVPSRGEICIRGKFLFAGYYKSPGEGVWLPSAC